MKKKAKRIAIDFAGYFLILLGLATGWLPGPGGIPLILGGLALLSINNHWARRLIKYLKQNGNKFMEILFPDKTWAKLLHDLLVVLLLFGAFLLYQSSFGSIRYGFIVALVAIAVADFLYNRNRGAKISAYLKH